MIDQLLLHDPHGDITGQHPTLCWNQASRLHRLLRGQDIVCWEADWWRSVCLYVYNCWCLYMTIVAKHCCYNLQYLLNKCNPFYLQNEFSIVYIGAVYIPPDASTKLALAQLHHTINKRLCIQTVSSLPWDILIMLISKPCCINSTMIWPVQLVVASHWTRCTLMYKTQSDSHLGLFDHLLLILYHLHKQRIKTAMPITKTISSKTDCFSTKRLIGYHGLEHICWAGNVWWS